MKYHLLIALALLIVATPALAKRSGKWGTSTCFKNCDKLYTPYSMKHGHCVTTCYRESERKGHFDRGCFGQKRCLDAERRRRNRRR